MFIDLSHTIEHGMITYKGLPGPVISDHLSREASRSVYDEGTEFHIGKLEMVANTGTYLDSPFHRYPAGKDLSQLELDSLANLEGVLVRCLTAGSESSQRGITQDALAGYDLKGKAVLFHTGWDRHWRTDRYSDGTHPFLTAETAEFLVHAQAALVGIDSFNIDDTSGGRRPAHSLLLAAEIPIVEHLCNLDALPASAFRFFAVPVKVKAFGTFPVRAFALHE
ncbi:MAG: cyclase family protein [Pyrinomonadaceae bacterium]